MTSTPTRILAIPGSLRRGSHSRSLIDLAIRQADTSVIEVFEDLGAIPHYNEDLEGDATPAPVLAFRERIGAADALLIATPEYNGSVPGVLKNALDWASRPYGTAEIVNKRVALISSSPSPFGATWALADLRMVLERSGAAPLERAVSVGKVAEVSATPEVARQIAQLVAALGAASREPLVLA